MGNFIRNCGLGIFFQHGEVVMFNYYQFLQQQAATLPSGTLPTGFNVIPGVTGPGNC